MNAVHRFVIAYDVASDVRRSRIAKVLERFGDRLQYSVFLVDAKPAKMVRLNAALRAIVNFGEDSILVCDLGPIGDGTHQALVFVGCQRVFTPQGPLVI